MNLTVTVLSTTTRLLCILAVNVNGLGKGLLVSNLRSAYVCLLYTSGEDVVNDALGIAFSGFIGYLAVTVAVHQLVPQGGPVINSLRYIVLAGFLAAALIYWSIKRPKAA